MVPGSLVRSFLRPFALASAAAALLVALAPAPAAAQGAPYTLTPQNPTNQSVREGRRLNLRVLLTVGTQPVPGQRIDWVVVSTTAGATGPAVSITDATGVASARFDFPRTGTTTIEARHPGAPAVRWTVTSVPRPVAPPPPGGVLLEPVGPTAFDLVLGDRQALSVRLRGQSGSPVAGEEVLFAVETSPGSPGVGRSNQTVVTGNDGVASATFGFSTAGLATIRASVPNRDSEPDSIVFSIDTASLGALDPSRQSYVDLGGALDDICLDVFVDADGRQRPVPIPTPLCAYMTGTLTTREGRTEAMHDLTSTGLGSLAQPALAGLQQQSALIRARIERLRQVARAGDSGPRDQVALDLGGITLSDEAIADALSRRGAGDGFDRALDRGFARLYAGLDAQEAQAPAASVVPQRERPWGFFVTGRLTEGEGEAGVEEDAFDFDTTGVTLGFDRAVSTNGFLGFAVAANGHETELTGGGGELEADSLSLTVYAIGDGEHGYVQATASYGQDEYDQDRRMVLPVIGELTAHGEFDGEQLGATLEFGRAFDGRAGSLTIFARGSFARASVDAFRETGAVAPLPPFGNVDFGLVVDEQEIDSLVGEAGLDWGRAFSFEGGVFVPQLGLSWAHEFEDDPTEVGARLISDTSLVAPFLIFTDAPDADWLRASAALQFQFLWGSLFVAYDQDLERDDLETRTVNAGLRFDF